MEHRFYLSLFLCLFLIVTMKDYFDLFLDGKTKNKLMRNVSYILYYIISTAMTTFSTSVEFNLFVSTLCISLIGIQYEGNFFHKLFLSLFFMGMLSTVEGVVAYSLGSIGGVAADDLLSMGSAWDLAFLIVRFVPFVVIKVSKMLLMKNKINIFHGYRVPPLDMIAFLTVPIISSILMGLFPHTAYHTNETGSGILTIIAMFLMVLNFMFFYAYHRLHQTFQQRTDLFLLNQQVTFYQSQYKQLKDNINELQLFKHDLKHHLVRVINQEKPSSTKHYQQLIDEIFDSFDDWEYKIYSKNATVDSILNYYHSQSLKHNIDFQYSCDQLEQLSLDAKLLSGVLGNALENALESCKNQEDAHIQVKVLNQHKNLFIEVSNSVGEDIVIENNQLPTTKGDVINHGFGLKSIDRLVELNGGYYYLNCTNLIFTIQILLMIESFHE